MAEGAALENRASFIPGASPRSGPQMSIAAGWPNKERDVTVESLCASGELPHRSCCIICRMAKSSAGPLSATLWKDFAVPSFRLQLSPIKTLINRCFGLEILLLSLPQRRGNAMICGEAQVDNAGHRLKLSLDGAISRPQPAR